MSSRTVEIAMPTQGLGGQGIPLVEDAVLTAEHVVRIRMPLEAYLYISPKGDKKMEKFDHAISDGSIQDIGFANPNGEYIREVIGRKDEVRKFLPGAFQRDSYVLGITKEPAIRIPMSHERLIFETRDTGDIYDEAIENNTIDDMTTSEKDPKERRKIIVGPSSVIRQVFPSVELEIS